MKKRFVLLLLVLLGFPRPGGGEEIARKILALYDPKYIKDPYYSNIHRAAEIWLNHLGMEVIYRPVTDPLPTNEEMSGFRGVLSWFGQGSIVPDEDSYCSWLDRQMKNGRKMVILGVPGFFRTEQERISDACAAALRTLGIQHGGLPTEDPLVLEVTEKDRSMVEFERPLSFAEGLSYRLFRPITPNVRVYLRVKRTDTPNSDSSLVVTTPRGGFVYRGYTLFEILDLKKHQWRINPGRFFEEAFGLKGLPRPDATTQNGRRIFYTHVDGDGIFNISHIDRKSYSGEIIDREIVKRYPDIPMTLSIITGYLDMPLYKGERAMALYRSLFSSPNVEPAAHGYAHPMIWRKKKMGLDVSGYHYDPDREIKGSVDDVNALLKKLGINKKTDLFQWTGDCLPYGEDVARVSRTGLVSINGGGGQFDRQYDSSSFLYPLGLLRGDSRQIYASSINENPYTNLWHGPFYGYRQVIETYKNSESPVRLKPINIYYHYYSGERSAALKAVEEAFRYALSQEIFPMFTRDYVGLVEDFFKVRMESIPGGFRVSKAGQLKTIRFDHEEGGVDLLRSRGVLGFRRFQGSLYVSLDGSPTQEIYLTSRPPAKPYLESSTFEVTGWGGDRNHLTFAKKGWYKSEAVLGGMTPRRSYRLRWAGGEKTAQADAEGRLTLSFPTSEGAAPAVPVTIDIKP